MSNAIQNNNNNSPEILHLFKLKGDVDTYIIGSRNLTYVDSVKIHKPLFITLVTDLFNPFGDISITPCNAYPDKDIDYSIILGSGDIMYSLHQDFIPKEVIQSYRDWWKDPH